VEVTDIVRPSIIYIRCFKTNVTVASCIT